MDVIIHRSDGTTATAEYYGPVPATLHSLTEDVLAGRVRWYLVRGAAVQDAVTVAAENPDVELCNCEHTEHFGEGTLSVHDFRRVPAGDKVAYHVGRICDACATGHMRNFLA